MMTGLMTLELTQANDIQPENELLECYRNWCVYWKISKNQTGLIYRKVSGSRPQRHQAPSEMQLSDHITSSTRLSEANLYLDLRTNPRHWWKYGFICYGSARLVRILVSYTPEDALLPWRGQMSRSSPGHVYVIRYFYFFVA